MDKLTANHLGTRIARGGKQWLAVAAMASVMLLAASAAAQRSEVDGLEVFIKAEKTYDSRKPINVVVTFKNNSGVPLTVLKWNTPFEGFRSDMFIVRDKDGKPARYIGRLYRRGRPTAEDYLEIPKGDLRKKTLDLSEAYEIRDDGEYTVQLKTFIRDYGRDQSPEALADRKQLGSFDTESNIARFEQRRPRRRPRPEPEVVPRFFDCSPLQEQQISQAHVKARESALKALGVLRDTAVDDRPGSRYEHWFGAYSTSNYGTVTTYFDKIAMALKKEDIPYSCDCNLPYYAAVAPAEPYKIWLCNKFWQTPTTESGSRLVTILHEMFHFFATGYAHHAELRTPCESLASVPGKAVQNADSYGFFAENDPPL